VARLVELVGYLNLVAYTALGLVALRLWRTRGSRAGPWAAASFGAIALVLVTGRLLPTEDGLLFDYVLPRLRVALLLLFPYLLFRFSTAFRAPSPRLERGLFGMTAVLLVWTFALPAIPAAGEPQPWWYVAFLVGFVAHWAVLSLAVAVRLWRAGGGQATVARRRMRLLSGAAAALTAAIFLAAIAGGADSPFRLATQVLALGSAVAFLLALAPPWIVRTAWRRPEEERLQVAVADLMRATSEEEVAAQVLPPAAQMVGARAVVLWTDDGRMIGTHGLTPGERDRLEREGAHALADDGGELQRVEFPGGTIVLWTTPYAPYFGDEELAVIRALGGLAGVALDRSRLFAQERQAREALEEADRIKSNFVALAAHELRSPVAAVHGIAETLRVHAGALLEERQGELRELLSRQSGRLVMLVDQLLDLSRLEAEAIIIDPQRLSVRERVEEIVRAAAGAEARDVRLEVPAELEADLDPAAFDRVVSNLVANALRYGGEPITVSAEVRDRHFRLTVEDRGPGVPPEFLPDLFERFTRGAAGREEGTGLGLAIARSYARAHAGDLLYEPAQPHGSRFQLVLPAGNGDVEAHVPRPWTRRLRGVAETL
jgi:signal transduction histidine kinase